MDSPEAFQALLLWLSRNDASGERKYEEVRQKLTLLFRFRGCPDPEDLADKTIDRTARAVSKPGFIYEGDPTAYFRGVARNIYYEWQRSARPVSLSDEFPEVPAPQNRTSDVENRFACLEHCLNALSIDKKALLLRYYRDDKKAKIDHRQLLAKEAGVGLNTLRIKVFRLRNIVRQCVETCLSENEIQVPKKSFYS
jgi:DNA-directed RNA polymerase specialized sigma24 family protein